MSLEEMQIWIEDVSERKHLTNMAVSLCAHEYSRLYGANLTADKAQADFEKLAEKPYLKTLVAFGKDTREEASVLATITFRLGSLYEGDGAPLEFMDLLHPEGGWQAFSHPEFDPSRTVEATLFSYAPRVTDADNAMLRIEVFRQLHSASLVLGAQHGCDRFWSILAKPFARFVGIKCKLPCFPVEGMMLNEAQYSAMFDRYQRYWRRGSPGIYITGPPDLRIHDPLSELGEQKTG